MSATSFEQIKLFMRGLSGVFRSNIAEVMTEAKQAKSVAEKTAADVKTAVGSKMDATNPVGTGSFSMGRKSGSIVGNSSHAEGINTTASGGASHAEGSYTTASGSTSHAEGVSATASGHSSHAEGRNTTASGDMSHAEGVNTVAAGTYSHVQGRVNIVDTENKYAHIVGNGDPQKVTRSNAHTLDWDGNAWFAGDVYVGGTKQDEGKKLLTENKVVSFDGTTLAESTVYTAELSGAVAFALATPEDVTRENRIRMLANVAADTTIDWGTTYYYGAAVPYVTEGMYEFLWEYNPLIGAWVAGATRIGQVVSA